MLLIEVVQAVMYCLSTVCYFILGVSYLIGRGTFWLLCQLCNGIADGLAILVIIGEEFQRFIRELDASVSATLRYIRSSSNSGIGGVIEAVLLFCTKISHFFTSTKLQSKLLATNFGHGIQEGALLVRKALLLIADWAWELIIFIPRLLLKSLFGVGDFLVFSISGSVWLVMAVVRNIIDDIFRYTIALVVIFVLTKQRWRLWHLLLVSMEKVRLIYRRALFVPRTRASAPQSPNLHFTIRTPLRRQNRQRSPSTICTETLLESQRCVVCRDQLKCVLLLPCKHLCLCDECANFMVDNEPINAQCPLCRSSIRQSMTVYI